VNLKKTYLLIILTISIVTTTCLSGCSTNINDKFKFNPKQFSIINNKIHTWKLDGKISWHHKSDNKSATCYMNWQKFNNKSQITFYSALNIQNLVIESYNNNQIKILSKNGKNYNNIKSIDTIADPYDTDNDTAEVNELQKTIDQLSINLNNLTYWLLGIPNPLKKYILIKDGFKQDDWNITYTAYQPSSSQNLPMPTKIIIKNSDPKNIMIIKIIVMNFN